MRIVSATSWAGVATAARVSRAKTTKSFPQRRKGAKTERKVLRERDRALTSDVGRAVFLALRLCAFAGNVVCVFIVLLLIVLHRIVSNGFAHIVWTLHQQRQCLRRQ